MPLTAVLNIEDKCSGSTPTPIDTGSVYVTCADHGQYGSRSEAIESVHTSNREDLPIQKLAPTGYQTRHAIYAIRLVYLRLLHS